MQKKSYMAFARLLGALEGLRTGDGKFRRGIAPEVKNQVDTIEKCLYGLLDRIAYCQFDRHVRSWRIRILSDHFTVLFKPVRNGNKSVVRLDDLSLLELHVVALFFC